MELYQAYINNSSDMNIIDTEYDSIHFFEWQLITAIVIAHSVSMRQMRNVFNQRSSLIVFSIVTFSFDMEPFLAQRNHWE